MNLNNFYDQNFLIFDWEGNKIEINAFKGSKLLIVNIASKCKLANLSYKAIEEALKKDKSLNILLCPCKQFRNQEYLEIKDTFNDIQKRNFFKRENNRIYLSKGINVKGDNMHPMFKFLINEKSSWMIKNIYWNFTMFLIDEKGFVCSRRDPHQLYSSII